VRALKLLNSLQTVMLNEWFPRNRS
jgi:hypothetical protein